MFAVTYIFTIATIITTTTVTVTLPLGLPSLPSSSVCPSTSSSSAHNPLLFRVCLQSSDNEL